MGKIILIGGAPAVGKSYLAEQLSLKLGIPWISTDNIHSLMLEPLHQEARTSRVLDSVRGFDSEGKPPPSSFKKRTPQEIFAEEKIKAEDVWMDVLSFIRRNDLWESYIVEGSAIMPHFIHRDLNDDPEVHPVFLLDKSEDRIRKVIRMKTIWSHDPDYRHRAKTLDLDSVLLFNRWLKAELKKYPYPCIELSDESISIAAVLKYIA
jgi:2-phosphoglycerate kinase